MALAVLTSNQAVKLNKDFLKFDFEAHEFSRLQNSLFAMFRPLLDERETQKLHAVIFHPNFFLAIRNALSSEVVGKKESASILIFSKARLTYLIAVAKVKPSHCLCNQKFALYVTRRPKSIACTMNSSAIRLRLLPNITPCHILVRPCYKIPSGRIYLLPTTPSTASYFWLPPECTRDLERLFKTNPFTAGLLVVLSSALLERQQNHRQSCTIKKSLYHSLQSELYLHEEALRKAFGETNWDKLSKRLLRQLDLRVRDSQGELTVAVVISTTNRPALKIKISKLPREHSQRNCSELPRVPTWLTSQSKRDLAGFSNENTSLAKLLRMFTYLFREAYSDDPSIEVNTECSIHPTKSQLPHEQYLAIKQQLQGSRSLRTLLGKIEAGKSYHITLSLGHQTCVSVYATITNEGQLAGFPILDDNFPEATQPARNVSLSRPRLVFGLSTSSSDSERELSSLRDVTSSSKTTTVPSTESNISLQPPGSRSSTLPHLTPPLPGLGLELEFEPKRTALGPPLTSLFLPPAGNSSDTESESESESDTEPEPNPQTSLSLGF